MWKNVSSSLVKTLKDIPFLTKETLTKQQIRTTFILKRKYDPPLHRKGFSPKKLRTRHYIYELVKGTNTEKQPEIELILTSFVDGLGNVGETVSKKPQFAYNNLLLPGLAVYSTPDNLEKYKEYILESKNQVRYSSANAPFIIKELSRLTLSVVMNKDHPWTIKPWHVKASFRKSGFVVPEDAITLPEKLIKGPDMNLENKEFYVTVTINKTEKVNVLCRLHHWSTEIVERIQHVHDFWKEPSEPIYPEFADVLNQISKKKKKE